MRPLQMTREMSFGQFGSRLPALQFCQIVRCDKFPPLTFCPMMNFEIGPIVAIGHHDGAQMDPPLQLVGIAMRIMANGQSFLRYIARIDGEGMCCRPSHGFPVSAQAWL